MFERLLFLGYLIVAVTQGALRASQLSVPHPSVPHPSVPQLSVPQLSVPHPMTTVIPKPNPVRQEATLQYFRHVDELDNNIVYRPFTSEFTTDMY